MISANPGYVKNGFAIYRDAIPSNLLDSCLHYLEKIKKRKSFLFYTQSTHRWEFPRLTRHGFLIESILNPSQQIQAPKFATSVRRVIYHESVYNVLRNAHPEANDFVSWQDMAFDRSTGTVDHLDSWYLDTEDPGGVVGIWIALEDIHMESGPFFVCPGSHHLGDIPRSRVPDHDSFLRHVKGRIEKHSFVKAPMLLKRGDILIWNSLLIHGAFAPKLDSSSRKSLTAHFYPLGKRRNDALLNNDFLGDLKCMQPTLHPRIHRLQKPGRSPIFYALGGPILAAKERIGLISSRAWNMRR